MIETIHREILQKRTYSRMKIVLEFENELAESAKRLTYDEVLGVGLHPAVMLDAVESLVAAFKLGK